MWEGVFGPVPGGPSSCVRVDRLASLVGDHPGQGLVAFVLRGLVAGFDVGYVGEVTVGREVPNRSARERRELVTAAVLRELRAGFLCGPFCQPPFSPFHWSPLGAADKPYGSARLILDLSSPRGSSINEGIDHDEFSVQYSTFDDALALLRRLGRGSVMSKFDIRHAFRLCPVLVEDWPLLGFRWSGSYFFHVVLPFGARSSPAIFHYFA